MVVLKLIYACSAVLCRILGNFYIFLIVVAVEDHTFKSLILEIGILPWVVDDKPHSVLKFKLYSA